MEGCGVGLVQAVAAMGDSSRATRRAPLCFSTLCKRHGAGYASAKYAPAMPKASTSVWVRRKGTTSGTLSWRPLHRGNSKRATHGVAASRPRMY